MTKKQPLTDRQKEFLNKLADLIEQFDASIHSTIDEDGEHIVVDGAEIFVGSLWDFNDPVGALRYAAR